MHLYTLSYMSMLLASILFVQESLASSQESVSNSFLLYPPLEVLYPLLHDQDQTPNPGLKAANLPHPVVLSTFKDRNAQ